MGYGCQPKNNGKTPQIIHISRVFHYVHHPFWWFSPYFWKHPYAYVPNPKSPFHPMAAHGSGGKGTCRPVHRSSKVFSETTCGLDGRSGIFDRRKGGETPTYEVHPRKLRAGGPQNDGLEKVTGPFNKWQFLVSMLDFWSIIWVWLPHSNSDHQDYETFLGSGIPT